MLERIFVNQLQARTLAWVVSALAMGGCGDSGASPNNPFPQQVDPSQPGNNPAGGNAPGPGNNGAPPTADVDGTNPPPSQVPGPNPAAPAGADAGPPAGNNNDNNNNNNNPAPPAPPTMPGPATAARSCMEDTGVILQTPSSRSDLLSAGMNRYTELVAPNGKSVIIAAQDAVEDLAIYRARNLMRWYLEDVPDSRWGTDKTVVFNAMADNGAMLAMPAGAHREGNEPNLNAQPLYEHETPVEGSAWYMNNNYEYRDAAFEEIFHLVHDSGIGTYLPGALPDYQADLLAEAEAALQDGRWGQGESGWISELRAEGSLAQEYIASVIDSYYGLWGPWDEGSGGMWGIYIAKTRDDMVTQDPAGKTLLEQFLPAYVGYEARLAAELNGTFSMTFDASQPYTHKSQYLIQATLTGSNNSHLVGNAQHNRLRGNTGDNLLDGAGGSDTVIYCSPRASYTIDSSGDDLLVSGPDGSDTLRSVEFIHFADEIVDTSQL